MNPVFRSQRRALLAWVASVSLAMLAAPPAPPSLLPITLNLAEASLTGTATINADGTWTGNLVARGTWR